MGVREKHCSTLARGRVWECKRKTALLEQGAGYGSARERLLYLSKGMGMGVQEKDCFT
ncbi:hypothetical protein DPMN_178332 [Dreissena polymorpha]|uniref:Uncharacterized protein n=1 Tax=Dreissena polymorpha TaxID=45954 RepID=A0A9D4IMH8_DREPO|nr:hypothetical protein DPMN_178332 [Dreissena polymorpha]